MTLTDLAVALGCVLAPTLPLAYSHPAGLIRLRDWWLRGVALVAILVAPLWLAPIAAWYAWRWPQEAEPWRWVPRVAVWTGLAITWGLMSRLEPAWWPWVARGWVVVAAGHVGLMAWRAWHKAGWRGFGQRQTATVGTPVMEAALLALTAPFWPWWGWPWLALGLWLTSSWAAWLAIGLGLLWLAA